jgi:hypothetical protein
LPETLSIKIEKQKLFISEGRTRGAVNDNVSLAEAVADESELSSFGKIKFFVNKDFALPRKR